MTEMAGIEITTLPSLHRMEEGLSSDGTSQPADDRMQDLAVTPLQESAGGLTPGALQQLMTEPAASTRSLQDVEEGGFPQAANENAQEVLAFDQLEVEFERDMAFYAAAISLSIKNSNLSTALIVVGLAAGGVYLLHERGDGDTTAPVVMMSILMGVPALYLLAVTAAGCVRVIQDFHNDPASLYRITERAERPSIHAFGAFEETEARKIRQKLEVRLREYASEANVRRRDALMVTTDQLREDIDNIISNDNGLTLYRSGRYRLDEMLGSEDAVSEIRLIWTYFQCAKTSDEQIDLKRQFVDYLAKSQGCEHGRANQVLLFFQGGIDSNIATFSANPVCLKGLPKSEAAVNELKAQFATALTLGLQDTAASKRKEKNFLINTFVKGQPYRGVTPGVTMTKSVFNKVYPAFQAEYY